jgi:hypothetical protein
MNRLELVNLGVPDWLGVKVLTALLSRADAIIR